MLALTGLVASAPAPADCNDKQYDQQQSGSENYRLSVANVIVAVAPLESLLLDFGDIDLTDKVKPVLNKPLADFKPQESKSPIKSGAPEKPNLSEPESTLSGDPQVAAVNPKDKSKLKESESHNGESQPNGEKEPIKEVKSTKQEKAQR